MHPDPYKRYDSLSEFTFELRNPNAKYGNSSVTPLMERNPLLFWKSVAAILACLLLFPLIGQHGLRH